MSEYVPTEVQVRHAYVVVESRSDVLKARAEFDRFLARVRRDAVLALAEHFSAEAIGQARQGNSDGADFYRTVAAEIEKHTPEQKD